jgi:hypothetical protein
MKDPILIDIIKWCYTDFRKSAFARGVSAIIALLVLLVGFGVTQCAISINSKEADEHLEKNISLERITVDDEGDYYIRYVDGGRVFTRSNAGIEVAIYRANVSLPVAVKIYTLVHRPWLGGNGEYQREDVSFKITLPFKYDIEYVPDGI